MTFYRFARAVVLSLCKVLFRVRVYGREHVPRTGVYIVAPSHRSIFDIPFAAFVTRRRIRFMAKDELFSTAIGGWLFTRLGAIKVDRDVTDRGALRASQEALLGGEPLAIFPEGTRRSGPTIESLFDGVAYLAAKHDVAILPVGIGGSQEILPSGKIFPRIHKVAVVVGEPIVPVPGGGTRARVRKRSEISALTERLEVALQSVFDEANRRVGARPQARPAEDDAPASAPEAREHV